MRLILAVLLVLLFVGMLPVWPYAATWGTGYWPSGSIGLALIVLLVMAFAGGTRRGDPLI